MTTKPNTLSGGQPSGKSEAINERLREAVKDGLLFWKPNPLIDDFKAYQAPTVVFSGLKREGHDFTGTFTWVEPRFTVELEELPHFELTPAEEKRFRDYYLGNFDRQFMEMTYGRVKALPRVNADRAKLGLGGGCLCDYCGREAVAECDECETFLCEEHQNNHVCQPDHRAWWQK